MGSARVAPAYLLVLSAALVAAIAPAHAGGGGGGTEAERILDEMGLGDVNVVIVDRAPPAEAGPAGVVALGAVRFERPGDTAFAGTAPGCSDLEGLRLCGPGGELPDRVWAWYLELAEPIQTDGLTFGVIRVSLDHDGDPSNNQTEGPFTGADRAFELSFTPEYPWSPQGFRTEGSLERIGEPYTALTDEAAWIFVDGFETGDVATWSGYTVLDRGDTEHRDVTESQTGVPPSGESTTTTTETPPPPSTTPESISAPPEASTDSTATGSTEIEAPPGEDESEGGISGAVAAAVAGAVAAAVIGAIIAFRRIGTRGAGTGPPTTTSGETPVPGTTTAGPDPCGRLRAMVTHSSQSSVAARSEAETARDRADRLAREADAANREASTAQERADSSPEVATGSSALLEIDGWKVDEIDQALFDRARDALVDSYPTDQRANNPQLEAALADLRNREAFADRRQRYEADVADWKDTVERLPDLRRAAEEVAREAAAAEEEAGRLERIATETAAEHTSLTGLLADCERLATEGGFFEHGGECFPEGGRRQVLAHEFKEVIPADVVVTIDVGGSGVVDPERLSARFDNAAEIFDGATDFLKRSRGLRTMLRSGEWRVGPLIAPSADVAAHEIRDVEPEGASELVGAVTEEFQGTIDLVKALIPIEIPTSVPQAVAKVPAWFARFGSLAARIGGNWADRNAKRDVRIAVVELEVHVRCFEVLECRGGQVHCAERWFVTDYGKIARRKIDEYTRRDMTRDEAGPWIEKCQTVLVERIRSSWRTVEELQAAYTRCP